MRWEELTGDRWLDAMAQSLVRSIRAIKADTETKRLQDEFYAAADRPRNEESGVRDQGSGQTG